MKVLEKAQALGARASSASCPSPVKSSVHQRPDEKPRSGDVQTWLLHSWALESRTTDRMDQKILRVLLQIQLSALRPLAPGEGASLVSLLVGWQSGPI